MGCAEDVRLMLPAPAGILRDGFPGLPRHQDRALLEVLIELPIPGHRPSNLWRCLHATREAQLFRSAMALQEAAESAGVSYEAARRWLAGCGGVLPTSSRAGRPGCENRRLSAQERETIGLMLAADESISDIARAVGRDKSTISRERQRHVNRDGTYRPLTAQKRAEQTARTAHARTRKLSRPGQLRDYVKQGLQQRWSPQEIAYRLPQDHPDDPLMRVSAETIYQSLFVQARGSLKRELTTYLRTQRRRRQPRAHQRANAESGRGRLVGTVSRDCCTNG